MNNGQIRIYGCGGAGINLTRSFHGLKPNANYADVLATFIDTSNSNLDSSIPEENCFLLPDVDGSGKVRRENHVAIGGVVKQILLTHKPAEFNVVVFSGSGGSGSVIGPLLVKELLETEATVVCVMVGSDESAITCTNTLNTLKSLDSISKTAERPVVVAYEHNEAGVKRSAIDVQVHRTVSSLTALCSSSIRELDTQDLSTWLYYNRTSPIAPQLSELIICTTDASVNEIKHPISIASLLDDPDKQLPSNTPDYSCVGYRNVDGDENIPDLHFVIATAGIKGIQKLLTTKLNDYTALAASRDTSRNSLLTDGDEISDSGMVL